jgi:hypothetical protein
LSHSIPPALFSVGYFQDSSLDLICLSWHRQS